MKPLFIALALLAACSAPPPPPAPTAEPGGPSALDGDKVPLPPEVTEITGPGRYLAGNVPAMREHWRAQGFAERITHFLDHNDYELLHTVDGLTSRILIETGAGEVITRLLAQVDADKPGKLPQAEPFLATAATGLPGANELGHWTVAHYGSDRATTTVGHVRALVRSAGPVTAYIWFVPE